MRRKETIKKEEPQQLMSKKKVLVIEDERALPVSATEKETAMPTDDGWPPALQYIISDFLHVPVTCVIRRERHCELLHLQRLGTEPGGTSDG